MSSRLTAAELERVLEEKLETYGVPGASVAVLSGGHIMSVAAGLANVATGVAMTSDTVMHIGSITKILNATLVMQLVDEGRVDLNERVGKYLPDLRLRDPDALQTITVAMLLNHTSGIDGELLPARGHDEETIEKAVSRFSDLDQLFPPGSECSYSNAATVLAGYLAQSITGRSWYDLIRERIFEPLELAHSVTLPEEAILHRASVGHYRGPNDSAAVRRTSSAFLPLSFAPCGTTLMMSARDLVTFASTHIVRDDVAPSRILSRQSTLAMQQIGVRNVGKGYTYADGIGLGWMVFENGLLHHSGGGPGIASALYVHPSEGWAVAVLTNAEYGVSLNLINDLMDPWLSRVGVLPYGKMDIDLSPVGSDLPVDQYIGVYEDILHRYAVSAGPAGLQMRKQMKFAPYENMSTECSPHERLMRVSERDFFWGSHADQTAQSDAFYRMFSFMNPDRRGRMQHLGNGLRLYKRSQ